MAIYDQILAMVVGTVLPFLLTAVIGAVLTIVVQETLPTGTKLKLRLWANRLGNWLFRNDLIVNSKISRGYELEEAVPLDQLQQESWNKLEVKPKRSGDRFELTQERGGRYFNVDIRLTWESDSSLAGMGGMTDADPFSSMGTPESQQKLVEHVRISVEGELPRQEIESLLMRSYDLLRDTADEMPYSMSGDVYSITCNTGEPPLINEFISQLGFEEFTATADDGLEIISQSDSIKVRNLGDSEVDQAITKIRQMVTLFG